MKRLISWLLALTMIMSLPLSAFAAGTDVEIGDGKPDIDVGFDELVEPEVGSKENPFVPEWVWNEEQTEATATTCEIKAGATGYITITFGGLELFVNGVSYGTTTGNRWMPQILEIKNDTDAAATYELKLVVPVGTMDNPATLVLGENVATVAAGAQGYFYTYTADQDGTLVLEFDSNTTGWTYQINNLTTNVCGDIQCSDSDPVVNPYEVEVATGDELQIMVNTYDPANKWNSPAGTVTVNASYKAEEPEIPVATDLTFYRANTSGGDLMLGDDIRASFMVKPNGYSRVYLEITKDGVTSFVEKNELSNSSMYRYAYVVPAAHMTMDINLTIWGEKDGVTYRGEQLVFSVRRCVEAKLASWINNPAAAGQCKLLMNMLYYGEKAQLQFGINPDNLATVGLPKEYLDLITTGTPSLKAYPAVDTTGMIAKLNTMGFMLQEKVKLNVIFTLTSAVSNPEEYYVEVKHIPSKQGVAPVTYTYTSEDFTLMNNNKAIQFFFDKIAPSQMRDDVEYTVYRNGVAISATYVRGMETVADYYVTNAPALAELVYAIMNYADAAKAVFG